MKYKTRIFKPIIIVLLVLLMNLPVFSSVIYAASVNVEYKPFIWKTESEYLDYIYFSLCGSWKGNGISYRNYWNNNQNIQKSREILDPENHFREKLRPQLATPTGFPLVYSIIEYYGYTKEDFIKIIYENQIVQLTGYLDENELYPIDLEDPFHSFEINYDLSEITSVPLLSDYLIDVLYSGDEPLIKLAFKSPAVLYDFSSNRLYDFFDLSAMTDAELSKLIVDYTDLQQWNVIMKCEPGEENGKSVFYTDSTIREADCKRISNKVQVIDYRDEEYSPQTGTPIVPLAITATAALVTTVIIMKKKRVKYTS